MNERELQLAIDQCEAEIVLAHSKLCAEAKAMGALEAEGAKNKRVGSIGIPVALVALGLLLLCFGVWVGMLMVIVGGIWIYLALPIANKNVKAMNAFHHNLSSEIDKHIKI